MVAVNDLSVPPKVGIVVGRAPSHRVATLYEVLETDMYVVAWLVSGQVTYVTAPGVSLRRATTEEVAAARDEAKRQAPTQPVKRQKT